MVWAYQETRRLRKGENLDKKDVFKKISTVLTTIPNNFNIHKTVSRMIENKRDNLTKGEGIDWATAAALAFGSLLNEGFQLALWSRFEKRNFFSQAFCDYRSRD